MNSKLLLSLACSISLVGCATSPVKIGEARPVPSNRLLSGFKPLAEPSSGTGKIVVVRDAGILGAGAPAKLLVDGAPVARLWPGERVQFFPSAGDHILAVKPDPQLMGALSEISSSVTAGRTYYFRISISETSFKIQPTAQIQ
jgi:hypothetical protein